jgi:hypothetical protein
MKFFFQWLITTPAGASTSAVQFFSAFIGLTVGAFAQQEPSPASTAPLFDATRLRTGEFHYRIVKEGKEISPTLLTIEKQANTNFRFTAKFDGFNQQWLSTVTRAFSPVTAQLRMDRANGDKYTMDLVYDQGRVTASVSRWKPEAGSAPPNRKFTAEDSVPPPNLVSSSDIPF